MKIGNPKKFAIESYISKIDKNQSIRGIGYFLIHIQEKQYGVKESDATALACSFDEVEKRISMRNKHIAPFSNIKESQLIAFNFQKALYAEDAEMSDYFGLSYNEFDDFIHNNNLLWAPDGDEAFDDGSHVIQFDVKNKVRLIGFKTTPNYSYDEHSLSDLWIEIEEYYDVLNKWYVQFKNEWNIKVDACAMD